MTGKKTEEAHHLATVLNAVGDDYIDLLKDYIFQKCESIKNFLEDLKDDEFRKKAYNRIKTLLPKEDA